MGSANSADTLEPTIATSTPKKHDARRHAYLAYLHIMTKPNHPQVGTAEHRAIKLFRDYYPNARANGKSSKFRSARMATIRRFQKEHDSKILPPKVWKAILRGVSKMGAAPHS